MTDARRLIPAVDTLLGDVALQPVVERAGRKRVLDALRTLQARIRSELDGDETPPTDPDWYARAVSRYLDQQDRPSLRRVINATGVVLHTNLGRAPLAEAARRAVAEAAGYATLEYDVESGGRGSRHDHCVGLLRELTGAEAALVVNNNAAAVVLALNTMGAGGEAVISRGELVEIGGSFRVPEIMARSGVAMREVGATNRTHPKDYRDALGPETRLILKVHRSNFRLEGFTAEVGAETLAEIAHQAGLPLLHDLGSGALLNLEAAGLPHEPTAGDALRQGGDVVTMSGDKLLGGPQAGILLGRRDLLDAMRANPLCRAFRCDKLTLAGLEATLALYRDPDRARREVPTLRMLSADLAELERRARGLARRLADAGIPVEVAKGVSTVGGGAFPGVELPSMVVAIEGVDMGAEELARRLRLGDPGVIVRVREGRVVLDPRTVEPDHETELVEAVAAVARGGP